MNIDGQTIPTKKTEPASDRAPKLKFHGPVSVLTVSNRPAFWPFVRRQVGKQQFAPDLQHVVVATYPEPDDVLEGTIWYEVDRTMSIGGMRNMALQLAQADYGTFIDDDDWQHPRKVADLCELLVETELPITGFGIKGWFLDLYKRKAASFLGTDLFFANAIFRIDAVKGMPFDNGPRGSDTRWLRNLEKVLGPHKGRARLEPAALWLQHGQNTVDRSTVDYRTDPADLFADDVWTVEDDYELDELERRLR